VYKYHCSHDTHQLVPYVSLTNLFDDSHHVVGDADDRGRRVYSVDCSLRLVPAAQRRPARRVTDAQVAEYRQRYRQPDGDGVAGDGEVNVEDEVDDPRLASRGGER